eukprot:gene6219-2835_t
MLLQVRGSPEKEMLDVLKAVATQEYGNSGDALGYLSRHMYRCPNGHMYMIGDCGMAMQVSHVLYRCPNGHLYCPKGHLYMIGDYGMARQVSHVPYRYPIATCTAVLLQRPLAHDCRLWNGHADCGMAMQVSHALYRCPNGHLYCPNGHLCLIGDCGMAMQVSHVPYRCPNGHVYCHKGHLYMIGDCGMAMQVSHVPYRCPSAHLGMISDCGMAMQQSRCPECGASVGGGNHALRPDNASAADDVRRMQEAALRNHGALTVGAVLEVQVTRST